MRFSRSRGQALTELGVILPLLLTMFLGVYTLSIVISDQQVAGNAVRSGARLGAERGMNHWTAAAALAGCQNTTGFNDNRDPCQVDDQIVDTVGAIAAGMHNAVVSEVDIYLPCASLLPTSTQCTCTSIAAPAPYNPLTNPHEVYKPTTPGTYIRQSVSLVGEYNLKLRGQTHPNERVIGVQLQYDVVAPTPFLRFAKHQSVSTIICLDPVMS